MKITNPTGTVLYLIEQAIKEYRKVSQRNISKIVKDISSFINGFYTIALVCNGQIVHAKTLIKNWLLWKS